MIVKNNLSLGYDLSDNVIITIPKSYIRNIEQNILLKSIEKLIESATKKINRSEGRSGDSAADVADMNAAEINAPVFTAVAVSTKGFKFDRNEANER